MELETSPLEEGELSDDSDNNYTPLERPTNYGTAALRFPTKIDSSESEDELFCSTSSDSDSDCGAAKRAKRPKIKPRRLHRGKEVPNDKKKFNVWSNRCQDDSILATLNKCGVSYMDRSRDVESYDYRLSEGYSKSIEETRKLDEPNMDEEEVAQVDESFEASLKRYQQEKCKDRTSNKRNRQDMKNKNLRLTRRKSTERKRGVARILLELNSQPDCSDEIFAVDIANKLCEEKEELVVKIVNYLGREKAAKYYNQVKKIESEGGMLIMNQSRRRTPGGVFLFLVRHGNELTREQLDDVFENDRVKFREAAKAKKKQRNAELKAKIAAERNARLPNLLNRAELEKKLSKENWSPKQSDQEDVINPPPTPETDCHSGDEINPRQLQDSYAADFLDLSAGNDMDLF